MKKIIKYSLLLTVLLPILAFGQFVNIGTQSTATTYGSGNSFHDLMISMNSDVESLYTPEGDSLSLLPEIYFDGINWGSGNKAGAINLSEIGVTPFFLLQGSMDIGYIGNESGDDNELYVAAYADETKTLTDIDDTNVGTVSGNGYASSDGYMLFDYDENDVNNTAPINTAPGSYSINLQDQTSKAYVQFTHWNRNPNWYSSALQDDSQRFKFWAVLNDAQQQTGQFLLAISDRNVGFDSDRDDGFFFISGDVSAVPEPSEIVVLAFLGLLGLLGVRRYITK